MLVLHATLYATLAQPCTTLGVVVVYPQGDWYGFVDANRVETIVDEYLQKGQIVSSLWRGKMVSVTSLRVEEFRLKIAKKGLGPETSVEYAARGAK